MKKAGIGWLGTLRRRLALVMGICVLGCFVMMVMVSHMTLQSAERNRVETTMRADLLQLSQRMDDEYDTLLQMTQQMTVEGIIGEAFVQYLETDEPYERIQLSSDISTSINTMIFSHQDVSLVTYLQPESKTAFFSTMPFREETDPRTLYTALDGSGVSLQTPHTALNRLTDKSVISISRPVYIPGEEDLLIYVEAYLDPLAYFHEVSQIRGFPYALLLVGEDSRVCYSTCEDFDYGSMQTLPATQEVGKLGNYTCVATEGKFGFRYVLLMHADEYNRLMQGWAMGVAGVFLLALAMMCLSVFLLFTLIYHPLQTLRQDMEQVGRGDFRPVRREFHMVEFDSLFCRFDGMKREIAALIENNRRQEKEKRRLEIDKLYYQINPHFLMNALNSVHWMAVTNHQPEIDRFVYQLNYILGYSLGKTDKRATFRTELKSLDMYLSLQKMRYDFEVQLEIEEGDYLDYPCARLILQPLAENAVCHNMNDFGLLTVSMRTVSQNGKRFVRVELCDDGRGIQNLAAGEGVSQLNKGIGLRYVQMSLESFYGGDASIEIESTPGSGTTVRLLLPIQKEDGKPCTAS